MSTINGLPPNFFPYIKSGKQCLQKIENIFLEIGDSGALKRDKLCQAEWDKLCQAEWDRFADEIFTETQPETGSFLIAEFVPSMQKTAEVIDQTASAVRREAHRIKQKVACFTGSPQVKEVTQPMQKTAMLVEKAVIKAKGKKGSKQDTKHLPSGKKTTKVEKKTPYTEEEKKYVKTTLLSALNSNVKVFKVGETVIKKGKNICWKNFTNVYGEKFPNKSKKNLRDLWTRKLNPILVFGPFSEEENEQLLKMVKIEEYQSSKGIRYGKIARALNRDGYKVRRQIIRLSLNVKKKVPYTAKERQYIKTTLLSALNSKKKVFKVGKTVIKKGKTICWDNLAKIYAAKFPYKSGKNLRNLWTIRLDPMLVSGPFSEEENKMLLEMAENGKYQSSKGIKYSEIAKALNRGSDMVRNHMRKLVQQGKSS